VESPFTQFRKYCGAVKRAIFPAKPFPEFERSDKYWEQRYRGGGNSGSGSYGQLAEYKAKFINDFVQRHQISRVVEFGVGDGNQLQLCQFPVFTGVDISQTAISRLRRRYFLSRNKSFLTVEQYDHQPITDFDLAMSLDVIFHLVENDIYDAYMKRLFASSKRFVMVYSSNEEYDPPASHVRHRQFTRWVEENAPQWKLTHQDSNPHKMDVTESKPEHSPADFFVFDNGTQRLTYRFLIHVHRPVNKVWVLAPQHRAIIARVNHAAGLVRWLR